MHILRIEHPVIKYDGWKEAFDRDPVGREKMGVRRHRVLRAIDDPRYIMIDLEFETAAQAEAMLTALREMWGPIQGKVIMNPQTRIVETIEEKEYSN